ncbi:MAG: alpha/beta fold hydrolase [Deltaproteobacteria bacterium]|nr:alpha/beta fold hydrolase [Deltaproteobacteria bacterium]
MPHAMQGDAALPLEHLRARTYDGVDLPVDVRGNGPGVIFINGLTQTTAHWRTQLRLFAEAGWRAAAYDGRGQGEVPAPEALTREHHARDLAAVQDALGWEKCHVVGFSHGSRVAIAHALRFPARVDRLVLVAPSGGLNASRRLVVQGWRELADKLGPESLARQSLPWILSDRYLEAHAAEIPLMVKAAVRRNRREGILAMLDGLLRDPGTPDELERITAPTLLMTGSEDRFSTPAIVRTLMSRIPRAKLDVVEGAGHTVAIEMPDIFFLRVDAFLRG